MGAKYLTDLADVCDRTGYDVVEVEGWQSRARGSGGYDSGRPNHVIVHHTASGPSSDGWPDVDYCTFGDDDAPLCNLYLARDGTIYVCAAGATNTNGTGSDPCGVTADDSMNSSAIGIEAGNNGTGEPWPGDQQDAYVRLCAELCAAYAIPASQVHSHREWAPERKTDPAGPSAWAASGPWDMDAYRADVAASSSGPPPPPDQQEDVEMFKGLWVMEGLAGVYAVYSSHKVWLPNTPAVQAKQALCRLDGLPDAISVQPDAAMFQAFGPILGPRPGGVDEWGVGV